MKKLFLILGVAVLLAAFTVPAMAAEWNFYGSVRVSAWSIKSDYGDAAIGVPNYPNDERNTRFQLQNNSRLGAIVKAPKMYSRFEFGLDPDLQAGGPVNSTNARVNADPDAATAKPYLRLLFGVWDFGVGKLVVGQDYTGEYQGTSNANNATGSDSVMIGRGQPYTGRRAQLRLEFGGFDIAVVDATAMSILAGMPAGTRSNLDVPKLVAHYKFKIKPLTLDVQGSYLTYDLKQYGLAPGAALPDLSVDAWSLGARAMLALGPVSLKGVGMYGINAQQLGFTGVGAQSAKYVANLAGGRILDNKTVMYCFSAGYKFTDMFSLEAGIGGGYSEQDESGTASPTGDLTKDDRISYYLQAVITMAPGVYIVPEIGKDDLKKSAAGVDQGDVTWLGAKFQIDF